jgi:hypothetical protein
MPRPPHPQTRGRVSLGAARGYYRPDANERKGDDMYIGGGVLTLILIVLLLIWLF